MKTTIVIVLLFTVISSSFSLGSRDNTPFDGVVNYFKQIGYPKIPIFYNETKNDFIKIEGLVKDIIDDLDKADNFIELADAVAKIGKTLKTIAGDIREALNDTVLVTEIDSLLDRVNDIILDPRKFIGEVTNNIVTYPANIAWALFDSYQIYKAKDYKEFGRRFANIVLLIVDGIPIPVPPTNLRSVGKKYAIADNKCMTEAIEIVRKFAEMMKNKQISPLDIMALLKNLFQVMKDCRK